LKSFFLLLLIFFISVFFTQILAQEEIIGNREKEAKRTYPQMVVEEQTLEKTVDPKEYILGPGDVLAINLWEEYLSYNLPVTPEGDILIPQVGSIKVSGLSLEKASEMIKERVLSKYKNVTLTVTLVSLRKFKVAVTGAVGKPGTYSAFANERISEIIQRADGFLQNSSMRNIIIKREDGYSFRVDIMKFLVTGDKSKNPYALDGDIIYVPVREKSIYSYAIYGAVKHPGEFEYAEGDSLLDLINLAHGLTLDVNLSQAEIVRFGSDNKTTESIVIPIKELIIDNQRDENLPLLPDDRVFIRSIPKFHEKKQATILGEVLYPGVYAVEEGKTKLSELVSLAGGFTPLSSLAEAEMIRQTPEQVVDLEFERLKKMDVADMSKTEYEYFKTKSREKPGRVACDFEKLFVNHQAAQDILLKDGDIINIPARSLVVKVSGNVVNPGLIEYEPGKDYAYYIKKAGGFSFKARKGKVRIIKGITGEWIKPSKSQRIDPGDAIWIPEKPDRDYWGFFKDAMIVLGNVATIYLVVKSATN
jgi:protein involved in polysaccharide export with SLBB domain